MPVPQLVLAVLLGVPCCLEGSASATCTVKIGLLQLPANATLQALHAMAAQAQAQGADIVVAPEAFSSDPASSEPYGALAQQLKLAVVGTFASSTTTHAVLYDRDGQLLLSYSKQRGTFDRPTSAGANRTVVSMDIGTCVVRTALLLGTDYLFPETARALMPQGVQLTLLPLSGTVEDVDLMHFHMLAMDNRMILATANWAGGIDNTTVAGRNGRSGMVWAGSRTRPVGGHTVSGSHAGLMVFEAPISTLSMVGGGDIHREPFRYRHLCYDDDAPDPDLPPAGGAVEQHGQTDQTLTVAMLQMAPAALSDASVELNAQKAESFAREAKSKGADIVVMPEQWLVGYTATFPGFGSAAPDQLPTRDVFRYTDQAIRVDGPVMGKFKFLARELDMAIAVSHLQVGLRVHRIPTHFLLILHGI
jgi:predicted amidohydrolase